MIVTNTQRIDATMPTIKAIFDRGAKVLVLLSHLGRPDGRVVPSMSLQHVVGSLQHAVGESHSVHFVAATVGPTRKVARFFCHPAFACVCQGTPLKRRSRTLRLAQSCYSRT